MADITKCSQTGCPMADTCYRITATSDRLQSWSNFEYCCNENDGFSYYIKDNRKDAEDVKGL